MSTPTSNSVPDTTYTIPTTGGLERALLDGDKWGAGPIGTGVALDYSFVTPTSVFVSNYDFTGPFTAMSAAQQANISAVLQSIANVASISFTQVADTPTQVGDLRYGISPLGPGAAGQMKFPSTSPAPVAGDGYFAPNFFNNNADPNTLQYMVAIHETGHALGLKHPHDSGGLGINNLGLVSTDNFIGNTVMSYVFKPGQGQSAVPDRFPTTPMLLDVAALQTIYGANNTYNPGNDTYTFDSAGKYWQTIWDGGGNDTIVVTGAANTKVDLNDGKFSQIGDPITYSKGAPELRTVAIAKNAFIENATTGAGNDTITGNSLVNILDGGAGNDTIDGGLGADTMTGGAGDDIFVVNTAADTIVEAAGGGTDTVQTALGGFTLAADVENLTYTGTGNFVGVGNAVDNVIVSKGGTDTLTGGAGNDTLDGGTGADTMTGGIGDDTYTVDNAGDIINETAGQGTDTLRTITATVDLSKGTASIENLTYTGTSNFTGTGTSGVNIITGGIGNDSLDGGLGADTLVGGAGNDTFIVDDAGDIVTEAASKGLDVVKVTVNTYTLAANVENMTFTGTGDFVGTGNALNNTITGGAGNDTLDGGGGDDTFIISDAGDLVIEAAGGGTDHVKTTLGTYALTTEVENLTYTGTGNFTATGNVLANQITSGKGDDFLDGGVGLDKLTGGTGNDIYVVDDVHDTVTELSGTGTGVDEIRTTLSTFYKLGATIENLTYIGTGDFAALGNTAVNVITGGAGNDTLDGGTGNDTLIGGAGNDIYIVDGTGDTVTELAGGGIDTIKAGSNYSIAALTEIENLAYNGKGNFVGTGNAGDNIITGKTGNDTLNGGTGADTLIGGAGNDVFIVNDALDTVVEVAGQGTDTVQTALNSYTLDANVEALTFSGAGAFTGTGNAQNNTITGGTAADVLDGAGGNDTLNGGTGADILIGGAGNDVFIIDNAGDTVVEVAGEGTDEIRTALTTGDLSALLEVENVTYTGTGGFTGTGNAQINVMKSGAGNDTLDGGTGADTLIGGAGNDLYIVDDAGDVVTELTKQGTDQVQATLAAYTLAAEVENLTFTGTGDFAGTGNSLANTIIGGAGNDVLDGKGGADTLDGGLGDDIYVIDNSKDTIVEAAFAGNDTVQTVLASYTLGTNLENLTYTGATIFKGTGNAASNIITGAAKADTLDGGAGADTLIGGAGNDVYLVDNTGDVVTEATGGGVDEIRTAVASYTVAAEVENLTVTGGAGSTITGNGLNNTITGSTGADTLDGGLGNDTLDGGAGIDMLIGGAGNDVFIVNSASDQVVEVAGAGTDEIRTTVSLSLSTAPEVENLTFTGTSSFTGSGNASNNIITGGTGNDSLTAGIGADTLRGGGGNDIYFIADADDLVVEGASAGTDIVNTTLSSYTLTLNVENLTFTGTGDFIGTGNAQNNTITGGAGNDILDGKTGTDRLVGGLGDDTYIVGTTADVVVEAVGQGTDLVQSTAGVYTLSADVENLTYTGTAAFKGTGNASNNVITGGTNSDTLGGAGGADTLIGGAGADTLTGGTGSDIFVFADLGGSDRVTDFTIGTDFLDVSAIAGVTAFTDIQAGMVQAGADTFISVGSGVSITLTGVTSTSLTAADFIF